ncbi:recombinase family protein [Nonomuraea maritima]|uniref:recombinase family protein n=1 Tax=Nonomuraea maritima TaxID=683260 RepID=UPI00371A5F1B
MSPLAASTLVKGQELLPAIGYVRVSMMLGEKISPEIQMDAIRACAARKGYYIPDGEWPRGGWIVELDVTGRNFNRDITKAVAAIEQGRAHAIIVWEFSRFGRDREGNPIHLGRIERAGGELLSATEDVDARTPSGRLARGIHFEFAAYYSDLVGARWGEAFQNRLKRGLPPLGGNYFGYVRRGRQRHPLFHDRTLPDPSDGPERYEPDVASGMAQVLSDSYQRWLQERSFYKGALLLNRQGIRTPGGSEWGESEFGWMLDRGFGAGYISVHDPECRCSKASACRRRVMFPGAHAPVISPETWAAYQEARLEMKAQPRKDRTPLHPFSGFLCCGHCSGGMHMTTKGGLPGYLCGSRSRQGAKTTGVKCTSVFVQRSLFQDAVLETLKDWADAIESAAASAQVAPPKPVEPESVRLERDIARLDADLARQTDLVSKGVILVEDYVPARDRLHAERQAIVQRLEELLEGQEEPDERALDAQAAAPVIEGLVQEWDVLSVEDRRRLLMAVIERIEVWRDRLAPARIVVVPRWTDGAPIVRELPGRHRLQIVRAVVTDVLARSPAGQRYGVLFENVQTVQPCSKKVFSQAVKTLTEEGFLVREVLATGRGTVYRPAVPPLAAAEHAGEIASVKRDR